MHQHPMRRVLMTAGLTSTLALVVLLGPAPAVRADLLRPDATQTFPDIAGSPSGQLSYHYDNNTGVGTLQVSTAPSVLSVGAGPNSEVFINDLPSLARSETLQVKLDGLGNFRQAVDGNSFSMYGSVTIGDKSYSGLLLQGTPTGFGFQNPGLAPAGTAALDVNVNLTGGLLKDVYGPQAYVRIAPGTSTFNGLFFQDFSADRVFTNVRADSPPSPAPIPEPSTFAVLLACGGVALAYRRRGGLRTADPSARV